MVCLVLCWARGSRDDGEVVSAEAPGFMHRSKLMPFTEVFCGLRNRSSRSHTESMIGACGLGIQRQ